MTLEELADWVRERVTGADVEVEPLFVGPHFADFELSAPDGTRAEVTVKLKGRAR